MLKKIEFSALLIIAALLVHRFVAGTDLQVLLRILLTLLSIFYLWFSFFLFNKTGLLSLFNSKFRQSVPAIRIIFSVTMGFVYSFSFVALLFAVSFYPGMNNFIIISIIINILALFSTLIIGYYRREHQKYLLQFTIRSFILASLFAVYLHIPVNQKLQLLFNDHPSFIEAYNEYLSDPDNPEIQERLREERSAFR
ncbi:MAG: hypothetical protein ACOCXH_14290 [Cyclobacteriaceae bacterium]